MKNLVRTLLVIGTAGLGITLAGCVTGGKKTQCPGGVSPVPHWVHHVDALEGYYVGVGQAEPVEEGVFFQRQLARKRALGQLIQKIQVTVASTLELKETQDADSAGEISSSRTATHLLRVDSHLTLNEVTDAGTYQDPATCTLWIRLKIRRDLADNLIVLKQAKGIYQMTVDETTATPAQKLRWIHEAQVLLNDVDFSVLPKDAGNKGYFTQLFAKRKAELEVGASTQTVWLLSTPAFLRQPIGSSLRSLADNHGATYVDTVCNEAHECLSLAREHGGKNLVWIKAEGNISSGALGVVKGTLRLGIARFDSNTGSLLATRSDEGQIFAFDEAGIDWAKLAEELLGKYGMEKALE